MNTARGLSNSEMSAFNYSARAMKQVIIIVIINSNCSDGSNITFKISSLATWPTVTKDGHADFSKYAQRITQNSSHSAKTHSGSPGPCSEYRRLQIGAENSSFCGTKGRLAHKRHCVMRYTNQLLLLLLLLLLIAQKH